MHAVLLRRRGAQTADDGGNDHAWPSACFRVLRLRHHVFLAPTSKFNDCFNFYSCRLLCIHAVVGANDAVSRWVCMFYVFDCQVTNVRATGLLAQQGFTCGCHIAKLAEGGCLFGPRIGAATVSGPARTAMTKSITTAWSHQQLRIALQVRALTPNCSLLCNHACVAQEKTSAVSGRPQQQLNDMLSRITSAARHVLMYEDKGTQVMLLTLLL